MSIEIGKEEFSVEFSREQTEEDEIEFVKRLKSFLKNNGCHLRNYSYEKIDSYWYEDGDEDE